jgi:probable rRNA maturation factor
MMIDFVNSTDFEFDIKELEPIVNYLIEEEIELLLTNNEEIQQINRDYRNIDKPTDVLSFPYDEFSPFLGSIVISIDKARDESEKLGHSCLEEIKLLFIHGLLHVMGYDHEIDNGEMRKKEEEVIKYFNLPESLIVRVEK